MKRNKLIIIGLFLISVTMLFTVAAGSTTPSGNQYVATYRPQEKLAPIDNMGGQEVLKQTLGVKPDDIKLIASFPDLYNKKNFKDIKMSLIYGTSESLIQIDPSESWSKNAKLQNGKDLIWGAVTGDYYDKKLGNSRVTVGFVEIPQETKSTYNLVIEGNTQHPPVFLSFGNLDSTPEILKIIVPAEDM